MSRRRLLSDAERALWTGFARSIKPLRRVRPSDAASAPVDAGKTAPPPSLPPPVRAARAAVPAKEAPPLAPLGRRLKQRVARGREPIEARLDLHGLRQVEAHAALLRFLRRAQADGVKIALVVTGKGSAKNTDDATGERGVLKRTVPLWLSLPEFRTFVLSFEDASVGHGGAGALYVRLRRQR